MKYVAFEDMHGDGCGKIVIVSDLEFASLKPYRADMENSNPLPDDIHSFVWNDLYEREDQYLDAEEIPLSRCLIQRIC